MIIKDTAKNPVLPKREVDVEDLGLGCVLCHNASKQRARNRANCPRHLIDSGVTRWVSGIMG